MGVELKSYTWMNQTLVYSEQLDVGLGVFVLFLSVFGSLVNWGVILVLIKKIRTCKENSLTYHLLCQLAIADLASIVVPCPFTAFALIYGRTRMAEAALDDNLMYQILINIVGWLANAMPMASIFIVCIITFRRTAALFWPFNYKTMFSERNTYIMSAVAWFCAICLGSLPYFLNSVYKYFPAVCSSWADLKNFAANASDSEYLGLLFVVTILFVTIPGMFITGSCVAVVIRLYTRNRYKVIMQRKSKDTEATIHVARTVTLIPIAFMICYMPLFVMTTISFVSSATKMHFINIGVKEKSYVPLILHFIMIEINACINPLIYFFGSNKLRKTISNKLRAFSGMSTRRESTQLISMTRLSKGTLIEERAHGFTTPRGSVDVYNGHVNGSVKRGSKKLTPV